jgi:cob(I)alamin adenosyltransferase
LKIYTKTGDKGMTGLWGGMRLSKDHPRVNAYGDVDELNSCLGVAINLLCCDPQFSGIRKTFARVQEELFIVGALLATPKAGLKKLKPPFHSGLPKNSILTLEKEIDDWTAELKPLKQFILPGGGQPAAWLHLTRSVCRRAERSVVHLSSGEELPEGIIVYLNRLSDHLFTAARWVNARQSRVETPWQGLSKRP